MTTSESILTTKHATEQVGFPTAGGTSVKPVSEIETAKSSKVQIQNYAASQQIDLVVSGEEEPGAILHSLPLNSTELSNRFKVMKQNFDNHLYFSISSVSYELLPANSLADSNGVIALQYITDPAIHPVDGSDVDHAIWQESPDVSMLLCRQTQSINFTDFANPVVSSPWRYTTMSSGSDPRLSSFGTIIIGTATKTDSMTAGRYVVRMTINFQCKERITKPTTQVSYTANQIIATASEFNGDCSIDFDNDKKFVTRTFSTSSILDDVIGRLYLSPPRNIIISVEEDGISEDQMVPVQRMDCMVESNEITVTFLLARNFFNLVDSPSKVSCTLAGSDPLQGYISYVNTLQTYNISYEPQNPIISMRSAVRFRFPIAIKRAFKSKIAKKLMPKKNKK